MDFLHNIILTFHINVGSSLIKNIYLCASFITILGGYAVLGLLGFDVPLSITTPTARYATSARIPSTGWNKPINRHITNVNKKAIATGEIVCA